MKNFPFIKKSAYFGKKYDKCVKMSIYFLKFFLELPINLKYVKKNSNLLKITYIYNVGMSECEEIPIYFKLNDINEVLKFKILRWEYIKHFFQFKRIHIDFFFFFWSPDLIEITILDLTVYLSVIEHCAQNRSYIEYFIHLRKRKIYRYAIVVLDYRIVVIR